jgi:MFS family permease
MSYHWQKNSLVAPATIPLIYSGAMAVNGITALVFGRLFDRYGVRVLSAGIAISLLALPFGFLGGFAGAVAAAACWATGLGAQDASLRAGIAQVVSMNKRGSAFGAFNGIYGVAWFAGSVLMGVLYDHSILALVIFGVALQALAAIFFLSLDGRVRQAAGAR